MAYETLKPPARILLVEDDPASCELIRTALPDSDLAVAADGVSGLAAALEGGRDLVLMDIGLPGLGGIEALRRINERLGQEAPPIVMLTSFRDPRYIDEAFSAGAADYILKPYNLKELRHRVRVHIEHKRMRERLARAKVELEDTVRARTASLSAARQALEEKICALRETEVRLKTSVEHLDGIMASVTDAIITIEEDGRIVSVNRSAERLFGYGQHALEGRNVSILMSEPYRSAHYGYLRRQIESGSPNLIGAGPREVEACRRDGSVFPADVAVSAMQVGGRRLYVGVVRDITERRRNSARMAYLANIDTMTGLPNRNLFLDRLDHAMRQAVRAERLMALFFMDLDGFKQVNDTLGHHVGDDLLEQIASRLGAILRMSDTLARIGGDEFTLILEGLGHVAGASEVAEKILEAMSKPFFAGGQELVVSISIGITMFPFGDETIHEVLRNADRAMYRAKQLGRNRYEFHSDEPPQDRLARLKLDREMRRAAQSGQFRLQYQPQLDIGTGRIVQVEALARWSHPELGAVPPSTFVPLLESMGLIVGVGRSLIRMAAEQAVDWRNRGMTGVRVAVNLSSRQFEDPGLVDFVREVLETTGLPGDCLEFEITESSVVRNVSESVEKLYRLHALGLTTAIDDFGTGYSSLSYLRQFPIDVLKIDSSFVRDIATRQDALTIATTVIAMARSLHMSVVAEGVESEEQLRVLAEHGCARAQGHLISPPLDAPELIALLSGREPGAGATPARRAGP
jgi:diguanylate cyclase (GGDEF)-like protein/PAS domain S-box-containing protein